MAKAGQKPKYVEAKHLPHAVKLAGQGCTAIEIASGIGIAERTLYDWFKRYPQFMHAIKEAQEKPNRDVEASLFKRAIGYDVTEGVVLTDRKTGKQKTIRATKRHIPGDTTAMIFYLKNRVPARWKDVRHNQHAGKVDVGGVDLSRLTDKQLDDLDDLLAQADPADDEPTPAAT